MSLHEREKMKLLQRLRKLRGQLDAVERAIDGGQALERRTSGGRPRIGAVRDVGRRVQAELRGELGVARLKEADERTIRERAAHRLHFRELVAATKNVKKLR